MFTPELVNIETGEYVLVANHNTESESAARLSIEYNSARMAYGRNHLPAGVDKCVLVYDLRGQNVPSEILHMIREAFREIHELRVKI